ncbi:hypothetical protein FRB94_008423 [Tulasnella sp. JGI-2019a]|nr:hypothetical protein FRB94_008423 [Tulasnella sp. JGI-2019a]
MRWSWETLIATRKDYTDSGKTEVPAKEVAAPSNAALAAESGEADESADIEAGGSGENVA